ncbi:MAG: diaminopimelate decarboxylase [Bacteroidetes bacterium]|nr:diaminopimelate decarboxylase [Bacteroidota bacterium]
MSLRTHLPLFNKTETPFYFYDLALLKETLHAIKKAAPKEYHIHYALKANANPTLLSYIQQARFGADCVSGNEIKQAISSGFSPEKIVFAGVGKSDKEIEYALAQPIFCFNVESIHELQIINELAAKQQVTASVALRINPNVDAYTHKYITTGLEENKFGINPYEFDAIVQEIPSLKHIQVIGLHFHIGSQITELAPFKKLCLKINELNKWFTQKGLDIRHINVGGGLGINYQEPDKEALVNFESYFSVFKQFLTLAPNQEVHFELGRSVVGPCGSLISRVLYIKKGLNTNFAILDAGMTDLIRPALYQAYHKIENVSAVLSEPLVRYDVVGPICESSDCFGKAVMLPQTQRGDMIAIRSAGAYGEVMSSNYNLREKTKSVFVE